MTAKKNPSPRLSPSRKRAFVTALSSLGIILAAAPASYAATAAWNTDASSGNFNTAQWSNAGTPIAGGTYTVLSGDSLVFGTSTTTTLNNDLTGATYAGLTFNSGASAYTIGGNSFTLTGNITNNSTSTQTINNAIVISGARTFNATSGQLVFGGNITGSTGGSWTLTATNKITLSGTNNLTLNTNFGGLLINPNGGDASAGGVDITGSTTINGAAGNQQSGYMNIAGTVTLAIKSGGSLTINPTTGTNPGDIIGQNKAGTSTISVESGGSFNFGGNAGLAFGNNISTAIGVLDVSGTATINAGSTTATDTRSFVALGRDSGTGTVNLNTGGTLATDRNFIRDGSATADTVGAGNFNFKGGTLKALANQTDWLNSATINTNQLALSSVTTTSAASTIDSNGFTVGINNAITGSGGFHIISSSGNGTVHFGGSSYAYTGATSVDSGTFNTNAASVAFSGNLAVAGGKFTINGTGTGSVSTTGFSMSSGTWTVSIGDSMSVSGDVNITGGTLDLAAFNGSEGSNTSYNLFTSIGGTGSVNNLTITGYDTANWSASLGTNGVLTFSAIPEPSTYAALAGVLTLSAGVIRRRIRRSAAPAV